MKSIMSPFTSGSRQVHQDSKFHIGAGVLLWFLILPPLLKSVGEIYAGIGFFFVAAVAPFWFPALLPGGVAGLSVHFGLRHFAGQAPKLRQRVQLEVPQDQCHGASAVETCNVLRECYERPVGFHVATERGC